MAIRPAARTTRPALGGITVERMRRRHLRGVLTIERQVYPRPWTSSLFTTEMTHTDTRCYLVALKSSGGLRPRKVVVGYAGVMVMVGEAHITTVAVHPQHHRQKVASRLMVALMTEARAMGAQAATLEVRVANRGAQRLYAGFGFAPVGVRPGYYAETSEDAVIMWAHDLQGDEIARRIDEQRERLGRPGGDSGAPDEPVPWVRGRIGLPGAGGNDEMEL